MNYLITRHSGALQWIKQQLTEPAVHLDHLDEALVLYKGDTVIGNLPLNLVCVLCQRGVRYLHIEMVVPERLRGQELTVEQMAELGAVLVEYLVFKPIEDERVLIQADEWELSR